MMIPIALGEIREKVTEHQVAAIGEDAIGLGDGRQERTPVDPVEDEAIQEEIEWLKAVEGEKRRDPLWEAEAGEAGPAVGDRLGRRFHTEASAAISLAEAFQSPPVATADLKHAFGSDLIGLDHRQCFITAG